MGCTLFSEAGTDSEVTDEVSTASVPTERIPESEDNSPASSELIEPESSDSEVQSAQVISKGNLSTKVFSALIFW